MAPKRAAGAEDGTAVRKLRSKPPKRKTATKKPAAAKSRARKKALENDNSTVSPKKRKIAHGASTELQLTTAEDAATDNSTNSITTPACDAVLAVAELLENILSALPANDIIFRAQQVCKDWKDVVATSPAIQTKLWLKSQASKPVSPDPLAANHSLLSSLWTQQSYLHGVELRPNLPVYSGTLAFNPLLDDHHLKLSAPAPWHCSSSKSYDNAGSPLTNSFDIHMFGELNKVQHTWLDMYLTEPPVTTAQLDVSLPVRTHSDNRYHVAHELLHEPRGLTFRTTMDRVEQIFQSDDWRNTPRYRFCKPDLARITVKLLAELEA